MKPFWSFGNSSYSAVSLWRCQTTERKYLFKLYFREYLAAMKPDRSSAVTWLLSFMPALHSGCFKKDIAAWHLTKAIMASFPVLTAKIQCFIGKYYQPVYQQPSLALLPLSATQECTLHQIRLMCKCICPGWSLLIISVHLHRHSQLRVEMVLTTFWNNRRVSSISVKWILGKMEAIC